MIGGSSEKCEVYDCFSQSFAYIKFKSVLPVQQFYVFQTKYVATGNKVKIYNKKSSKVVVFNVENKEWTEEKAWFCELDCCLLFS